MADARVNLATPDSCIARAEQLAEERLHAAELLFGYRALVRAQDRLRMTYERCARVATSPPDEGDAEAFRRFVRWLDAPTTPLADAGDHLAGASVDDLVEALLGTLTRRDRLPADRLGADASLIAFHTRAFLQAVYEPPHGDEEAGDRCCPRCGWPPLLSIVADDADRPGARRLACALCRTRWRYPRGRCAACGEDDARGLVFHDPEEFAHVRLVECEACGVYWKEIDLRRDGRAVPEVDEIATPELDVWARERSLQKVVTNAMGI